MEKVSYFKQNSLIVLFSFSLYCSQHHHQWTAIVGWPQARICSGALYHSTRKLSASREVRWQLRVSTGRRARPCVGRQTWGDLLCCWDGGWRNGFWRRHAAYLCCRRNVTADRSRGEGTSLVLLGGSLGPLHGTLLWIRSFLSMQSCKYSTW